MTKNYLLEIDSGRKKTTTNKHDVAGIAPTGTIWMFAGSSSPTGWLLMDGKTVGKIGSGAYYTGEDYRDLFGIVKGCYPNAGTEDFDAGNTVALPDARQRMPLGKAESGTGSTLGAVGGSVDHSHTVDSHLHSGGSHTHTVNSHDHTITHTHTVNSHDHTLGSHQHDLPFHIDGANYLYYGNLYGTGGNQNFGMRLANDTGSAGAVAVLKSASASGNTGTASPSTGGSSSANSGSSAPSTGAASGNTGSTAPGTNSQNPPFLALNFIIKV